MTQLLLEQTALAASIALGGAVILLIIGTQILDWYWLVLLFGIALGIGIYRVRRRIPSSYVLAQRIDSKLRFHDTLSTAVHFLSAPPPISQEALLTQRAGAEKMAQTADLKVALPYRRPAAAYSLAVVAIACVTMFAIRYGVTRSLDLHPSLVQAALDTFFTPGKDLAANQRTPMQKKLQEQLQKLGISPDTNDPKISTQDPAYDSPLNSAESPEANSSATDTDAAKSKVSGPPSQKPGGDESGEGSGEKGEKSSDSASQNGSDDKSGGDSAPGKPEAKSSSGKQQSGKSGDNSSLMDKMKDAMANLMNKLKPQPKTGDGQQSAANQSQQGASQQQGQKGAPAPGKPSNGAEQQGDQEGDQQSDKGEKAQNAQGKNGDKNSERAASPDAKSGVGKQDGDKEAREAEQLQAMGKISEIIGKRSANVSGQVMVEVGGGKQTLKTAYSQQLAIHQEAGGEIHRDEVPLMYQQYVQQYFEEIRKSPGSAKASAPAKSALGKGPKS